MKITQEEIAKKLGVSKTTVSRALSGKGRIGNTTSQKIKEYVDSLENNIGKTEKHTRSNKTVGVVLPADIYVYNNPYFMDCLLGIYESASFMNYSVIVTKATDNDISEIRNVVENDLVDGIILLQNLEDDKALQYLEGKNFPTGLIGTYGSERVIEVDMDNQEATENLTSLLIGQGYRRFAVIVGELVYKVNRSRYDGFMAGLMKNSIPVENQLFHIGRFTEEMIPTIVANILSNKIECILCGDEKLTTKLMAWMLGEGYRIPDDVAIASCLNGPVLEFMRPSVTTVDMSPRSEGIEIGKQLINRIQGVAYQKKTIIDYEIKMRKSTMRGEMR